MAGGRAYDATASGHTRTCASEIGRRTNILFLIPLVSRAWVWVWVPARGETKLVRGHPIALNYPGLPGAEGDANTGGVNVDVWQFAVPFAFAFAQVLVRARG